VAEVREARSACRGRAARREHVDAAGRAAELDRGDFLRRRGSSQNGRGAERGGEERGERGEHEKAGTRTAFFDGDEHEAAVLDRDSLGAGSDVEGPAVVEFREATCVVRPGWSGAVDEAGTLALERS
jgi:N-methylhydantoinase A/oxoprolinase/acetone carboxylase beta subunit